MGLNTSLMLLNDRLHDLDDDPEVGNAIITMTHEVDHKNHQKYPYGYKGIHVIACQHADYEQCVIVGRNRGYLLSGGNDIVKLTDLVQELATTKDSVRRNKIITELKMYGKWLALERSA